MANPTQDEGWTSAIAALEQRAGVDSLEALQARRRQLLTQHKLLRGLYGPYGMFDVMRKRMLSAVAVRVRMEAQQRAEKITEAALDQAAHADAQYQQFLDEALESRILFIEQDNEMSEIEEKIRSREVELHFVRAEMGLAK